MKSLEAKKTATSAAVLTTPLPTKSGRGDALRDQARGMSFAEGEALFATGGPQASNTTQQKQNSTKLNGPAAEETTTPGGPGKPGSMGKSLVGHMAELNKSPALDPKVSSQDGKYNVGYGGGPPKLPPGTRVVKQDGPFGPSEELVFPKDVPPEEQQRIREAYYTAKASENGRVTDVWEQEPGTNDISSKYFVDSQPAAGERLSWKLKDPKLASEALDQWLSGGGDTTVADCASALVALQLQSLRDRVGDAEFNKMVGQSKAVYFIAPNPMDTPLREYMSEIDMYKDKDKGHVGLRNLKEGDAVYFANHPDYIKYDPKGSYSGENAIYMGVDENGSQRFSGFGVSSGSERDINAALMKHFNDAATAAGRAAIGEAEFVAAGGGLQTSYSPADQDATRGSPKGLRLDEDKVAAKLEANRKR